uniref:L-dopachrome isomerase n=1 Tax=Euprymna scolopes TaxID=6613 RepID=A0A7M1VIL6_EUPSC|nr:macrophage migration inhibitory factory [Euprymna scolopes]
MPTLYVFTNLSKDKIPTDFLVKATDLLSKQLGKPAKYITILVHPDTLMSHAGSTDPCASLLLSSIGKLGPDVNKDHSSVIGNFICKTFGIAKDRFYITFENVVPTDVGYNGSTF